jgi:hypothetical protein
METRPRDVNFENEFLLKGRSRMDADDIDVLNLLQGTTGLSSPARVTIFDVKRHAKNGRMYEVIVHVHDLGPHSHPQRFSAVISDKHDPTRRISSSYFPDVKEALAKLRWSELD